MQLGVAFYATGLGLREFLQGQHRLGQQNTVHGILHDVASEYLTRCTVLHTYIYTYIYS